MAIVSGNSARWIIAFFFLICLAIAASVAWPRVDYEIAIRTMHEPIVIDQCRATLTGPVKDPVIRYTVRAKNVADKAAFVVSVALTPADATGKPIAGASEHFVRFSGPVAPREVRELSFLSPPDETARGLRDGQTIPLTCQLGQVNFSDQSQWQRPHLD